MSDHQPQKHPALPGVTAIANDLVNHVKSGATSDAPLWDKHFSPDFVSVEADGMTWQGRDKVQEKHDWWNGQMTVHGVEVKGPYITPNGFCVHYEMDCESKDGSMPRGKFSEVGVYTVENNKVVREEFFGNCAG